MFNDPRFYDPLKKFSWFFIQMPDFPIKHLKSHTQYWVSKNTQQQKIRVPEKWQHALLAKDTMNQHNPIVRNCHLSPSVSLNPIKGSELTKRKAGPVKPTS